ADVYRVVRVLEQRRAAVTARIHEDVASVLASAGVASAPMEDNFPSSSAATRLPFGKIDDLVSRVAVGIDAARKYLFSRQHEQGYWSGELVADTTLESDYILLHTLLGTGNKERFQKCANYILRHQNEDGGWPIYINGPSNISASV